MTVTEKAAYLKGLAAGLELDEAKPEAKLIKAMLDVIDDLALTVADLEDELALTTEQLDAVDEDLDALEEFVYEGECCEYCDCDDEYDDWSDEELYEVDCPACGETVAFDEESLLEGYADCPNCGEKLEFDFDLDCDCEECADGEEE
ncbi:MAG: hypothetical protein IJL63_07050 [Clostridia bacterium]|nr:hypothetical protein [Clostridia bacterium]